jgi:O-antigen/teichoic acid export membrane protein
MSAETTGTGRRIGTAMAWSVLARGIRFVLGFATSVVVVRSLGQHDYGVYSVVRSVMMFAIVVSGVGTGQALLKFLPAMRVARSRTAARALVRRVALIHFASWLVLLATGYAARGSVAALFPIDGIGVLIAAAIALGLFEIFFTFAGQVLNASYDARRLSMASVASHLVYLGLLALLLPGGAGVLGVLAASAGGNAVACAMVWPRLRPTTDFGDEPATGLLPAGRLLRYAAPFAAIGVLNIVVWRQSETLLLAHFRTPEETGYFDLAYRLPQTILEFVPGTVWPLVMAGMSEAFARNPASLRGVIARYYRLLFALCAPLCLAGALFAPRAIAVLYGDAMAPAAVPMQLFFLILTVSFLSTPLSMGLYVLEKTHLNLLIYCILAVVNVGLDFILIPRYGVYGAIVPVALAIALQPLIYFVVLRRHVSGVTIPYAFIGRCFLASAFVVAALPVLRGIDGAGGLAAAALVGGMALAFGYRLLRVLGAEEASAIAAIPVPAARHIAAFLRR